MIKFSANFMLIHPFKRKLLILWFSPVVFLFASGHVLAGSSVNASVGSAVYRDLERLEVKGLIDSALFSTRPFGRLEVARLIGEAAERQASSMKDGQEIISRLESEFKDDMGYTGASYLRPEGVYMKSVYSADDRPFFLDINNNGDSFTRGGNLRVGFAARGGLFDTFSFYLNPEYRLDGPGGRGALVLGYVTMDMLGATIEAGRDSMWWGPAYHGDLLVTNNAKPFDMIKLTSQHPFLLPWIFKYIGLIKPTIFLTHLDEHRDFPRANLLGMRLDLKPTRHFELGLTRVVLFGGHGRQKLSFSDWIKILTVNNGTEHSNSPINGDQIASIDASYVYVNRIRWVPLSGAKVYIEWGAEDSSGSGWPSGYANVYGAFVDGPLWLDGVDLRIEWANTARNARYGPSWYTHGVYTTGYRYGGNIIGHHMGTDARDLYFRAQYHLGEKATFGIEGDWERSGIHSALVTQEKWIGTDILYYPSEYVTLQGGMGYQTFDKTDLKPGPAVWAKASLNF